MAVAFMAALEKSPETYDHEFDAVLEGRASQIRERILDLVKPGMNVLDLGCGTGLLATEAAKREARVVGIDSNLEMIGLAIIRAAGLDNAPEFLHGDVLSFGEEVGTGRPENESGRFDLIVTTFLLSELKPPQRDLLMQVVGSLLRVDGIFAVAAETLPSSFSERRRFWRNRSQAERQSRRRLPRPITNLDEIVEEAGLVILETEKYGSEITFIQGEVGKSPPSLTYRTRAKAFEGVKARLRTWYNHLTGGWRGIPIKPGLYKSGDPKRNSPIVVTANYELTYYTVMRALAKERIDAWVLVCDTDGINVWCAARGTHFDSEDVIQMMRLTSLGELVDHREIIMPQLSAAGMDPTLIRERTGFRVRYGPVRIQDLSEWLALGKPRPKPRKMASVTFNLRERMEQSAAHIPFLFAALLGKPIAAILGILAVVNILLFVAVPPAMTLSYPLTLQILLLIAEFIAALVGNAFTLGLLFPILPSKGNSFWRRGLGLAGITLPLAAVIMIMFGVHWTLFVVWMVVQLVMATSLTMDWSGMTSVSDPKVIRREYPYMIQTLKVGVVFIVVFNLVVALLGW